MSITLCRDATMQQFASAAGPFAPSDISGLQVWLKADAITSLVDGDPVTTWTDSSGNSRNAAQATSAAKPTYQTNEINSLPVVRFDGVDDLMEYAAGSDWVTGTGLTVFAVQKRISVPAAQNGSTISLNSNGATNDFNEVGGCLIGYYATGTDLRGYRNSVALSNATHPGNAVTFAETSQWDGTNHTTYLNGSPAPAVASNPGSFAIRKYRFGQRLGTSQFNNADYAEIIVYDSSLSSTDRESVERYLRGRWAVPAILRPNADITHNWAVTGGSTGWEVLDDVGVQPTAPSTGSDYIRNDASAEVEEVALTTASVGTVSEAKVWYYAGSGTLATTTTVGLYKGGTLLQSGTMAGNSANAWRSVTYTGSLTQAEVDDLRIRFTAPTVDLATVYAAYVEVTHGT